MKRENIRMIWDFNNRFLLEKEWNNVLVVVWMNPSTADDKKPDATMRKVMWFAEVTWYDWFAMINVIPQRATFPKDISEIIDSEILKRNFEIIENLISSMENPDILLAFWNIIDDRKYFIQQLRNLVTLLKKYNPRFLKIWLTKDWNPLHPSRGWYCKLSEFDVDRYMLHKY